MTLTSATADATGGVTLIWPTATGATGYTISFSIDTLYSQSVTVGSVLTTNIGSTNFTLGSTYNFRITPIGGLLTVSATKTAIPNVTSPTGIGASATANDGNVRVTWTKISGYVYKVQWAASNAFSPLLGEVSGLVDSSYTIMTNVTLGTLVCVKVVASVNNGLQYGATMAYTTATPSLKPVITLTTSAIGAVKVQWGALTNATQYKIEWATTSIFTTPYSDIVNATDLSYNVTTNLTYGVGNNFRVYASNNGGINWGSPSIVSGAFPNVTSPVITVSAVANDGTVRVTWTKVPGLAYKVQWGGLTFSPLLGEVSGLVDSSYTIMSGLTLGTLVYVRAYASVNGTQYGTSAAAVTATPTLKPIITLTASAIGAVKVQWGALTNATNYKIEWSTSSIYATINGVVPPTFVVNATDLSYNVTTNLTYGVGNNFRVYASNNNGINWGSPSTTTASGTMPNVTSPIITALATANDGNVRVTWTKVPGLAYKIQWAAANTFSTLLGDVSGLVDSSYTIMTGLSGVPLTLGTNVYVRGYARSIANGAQYGTTASTPSPAYVAPRTPPGQVVIDTITYPATQQVKLTWPVVSVVGYSGTLTYVPEYSSNSGTSWTAIAAVSSLTATFTGLTNGTPYSFRVTAKNTVLSGTPSTPISATPRTIASVPTSVAAVLYSPTSAKVTFGAPSSNGGVPILYYNVTPYLGTTPLSDVSGVSSPISVPVSGGASYTFKVRAVTLAGLGAQSSATAAFVPNYSKELPDGSSLAQPVGGTYANSRIVYTQLAYVDAIITPIGATTWTVSNGQYIDTLTSIKKIVFSDKIVLLVDASFGTYGNTISSAHTVASNVNVSGDIILLAPGVYLEIHILQISKSITLQGPLDPLTPVILSASITTNALLISCSNITVNNITFDTTYMGSASTSGNYIINTSYDVFKGNNTNITNLRFENIIFTNPFTNGTDPSGTQFLNNRGVSINGVDGLVFEGCKFAKTWNFGLVLGSCKNVTISNSIFNACPWGSIGIFATDLIIASYDTSNIVIENSNTFNSWDRPTLTQFVAFNNSASIIPIVPQPIIIFNPVGIVSGLHPISYGPIGASVNVQLPDAFAYAYISDSSVYRSSAYGSIISKKRYQSTDVYLESSLATVQYYGRNLSNNRYLLENRFNSTTFLANMSLNANDVLEFELEADLNALYDMSANVYSTDKEHFYVYNSNVGAAKSKSPLYIVPHAVSANLPTDYVRVKASSEGQYTLSTDQYKDSTASYPNVRSVEWFVSSTRDQQGLFTDADVSHSIHWPTASTITYGDALSVSTLTGGTAGVSGEFAWKSSWILPNANNGDVSYNVVFTPTSRNYTSHTKGVFVIVNKKVLSITYGGLQVTYNGLKQTVTATNSIGILIVISNGSQTNVGKYNVTATIDNSNYTGTASGIFEISKATATVTISTNPKTYTGSALSVDVVTTPANLQVSIVYTSDHINVGSHIVTATIDNSNYTGTASGIFEISKATPSVTTWPTYIPIVYGHPLVDSTFTIVTEYASVPGSFEWETPNAVPGVGTATYHIVFKPTDAANYNPVKYATEITLQAGKAIPQVTWPTLETTYGTTNFNSTKTVGSAVNPNNNTETVLGTFTFISPDIVSQVSTQTITMLFNPGNTDTYNAVQSDVLIKINRKLLTITANLQTKTYGDTFTFLGTEYGAVGLVNSDTISAITLNSTGSTSSAAVGSHPIVPSSATVINSNSYTISYGNGTLTVNAGTPDIPVITTASHAGTTGFISWLPPVYTGGIALTYNVYLSTDNFTNLIASTSDTIATIIDLVPTTQYSFKVSANNVSYIGDKSDSFIEEPINITSAISSIATTYVATYGLTEVQESHIASIATTTIASIGQHAAIEKIRKSTNMPPELKAYNESVVIAQISALKKGPYTASAGDIISIKQHLQDTGLYTTDEISSLVTDNCTSVPLNWGITSKGEQTNIPLFEPIPGVPNIIYTIHGIETKFNMKIYSSNPVVNTGQVAAEVAAQTGQSVTITLTHSINDTITDISTNSKSQFPSITATYPLRSKSSFMVNFDKETHVRVDVPILADMIFNNIRNVACFVAGTGIMTVNGYKVVENLVSEDRIVTADGRILPFKLYTTVIDHTTTATAPYRISKGAFGNNSPPQDIILSPQHAIQSSKSTWQIPKYAVKRFAGITQVCVGEKVQYYHIEMPNFFTDNIIANGSIVESYAAKQVKYGTKIYRSAINGFIRNSESSIIRK